MKDLANYNQIAFEGHKFKQKLSWRFLVRFSSPVILTTCTDTQTWMQSLVQRLAHFRKTVQRVEYSRKAADHPAYGGSDSQGFALL